MCALLAGLVLANAAWAQSAGRIGITQRLVWQQKADGTINPVEKGATFETGDVISTGRASSAQLVFSDGGEILLRPDSQLRVERYGYQAESPQADTAFFRLLKGGMRAVTGLIGKRGNRDAYRVIAKTATIGIRGTDFTTRICGDDCAEESRKFLPTDRTPVQAPAARLVSAQGQVIAINAKGIARDLEQKSAVYQGDTVRTAPGGYAILVFRDEGRMTLAADTAFTVEQFRYEQVRREQNSVVFRLVQGGLRALTGLISKRQPKAYRISTATATIGVRGTGFSACMGNACGPGNVGGAIAPLLNLSVHTWDGTVILVNAAGSVDVSRDQTAMLASQQGGAVVRPTAIDLFDDANVPRPDKIDVDMKDLFVTAPDNYDPGLYVYVHDGKIVLTDVGKDVIVESGEGAYADEKGGPPVKVDAPLALKYDPWLQLTSNICR